MTWRKAAMVQYLDEERQLGSVKVGSYQGPPLMVRERQPEDTSTPVILMEFEDVMKTAAQEFGLTEEFGEEPTCILALQLPSARKLCCHLIEALASSGDKVATRMKHMMLSAMADAKADRLNLSEFERIEERRNLGLEE